MQTDNEDRSAARNSGITRSDEFWYKDGGVVLVADDVAFRVYQGLLAEHSELQRHIYGPTTRRWGADRRVCSSTPI